MSYLKKRLIGCASLLLLPCSVTGCEDADGDADDSNDSGVDDTSSTATDGSDSATTAQCAPPLEAEPVFEDPFDPDWAETQTAWRRASWSQNGTQMSPERCVTNDDGLLEQTVLAGNPPQGGSMQSTAEYLYGRWVARLKPSSVPGVLNSMFTMDWDDLTDDTTDSDGTHQEIDIEFLTYTFGDDTGQVHLAVHRPDHTNHVSEDIELDFNPSDDFHEWGFDILPDRIDWHVDGEVFFTFEYDDTITIDGPYELFFNSWTRESWINGPPAEDAVVQIDWVRFYPFDESCE